MLALLLCASLSADVVADRESFLKSTEKLTQDVVKAAPDALKELRKSAESLAGSRREETERRIAQYEKRFSSLQQGKSVVVPMLPFPPKPGDMGKLPTKLKLWRDMKSECVFEADWSNPLADSIVYVLPPKRNPAERTANILVEGWESGGAKKGHVQNIESVCVVVGVEQVPPRKVIRVRTVKLSDDQILKALKKRRAAVK